MCMAAAVAQRQAVFQQLRPVCKQLLQFRTKPAELHAGLTSLHELLKTVDAEGLHGCWDYVAFPLLLIADSIAPARAAALNSRKPTTTQEEEADNYAVPAAKSDRVAEEVLGCLLILFQRCPCRDEDQRLSVLQRLAPLLRLDKQTASEEIRTLAFQCIHAAAGHAAGSSSGAARASASPQQGIVQVSRGQQQQQRQQQQEAMAGSTLVSEAMAPLLGVIIHSCLEVAEQELLAGPQGSKGLRLAALQALTGLVAAVHDPEALAFFLPGIASGLARHMAAAGSGSGSSTVVEAIHGFVMIIDWTLGDQAIADLPQLGPGPGDSSVLYPSNGLSQHDVTPVQTPAIQASSTARTASSVLAALHQIAATASSAAAVSQGSSMHPGDNTTGANQQQQQQQQPGVPADRRLRVHRSAAWVQASSERLHRLLVKALPPLCNHPRPAVREAVAHGAMRLLQQCRVALQPGSKRALLELVFSLAQDEWPQVSSPCVSWISSGGQAAAVVGSSGPHGGEAGCSLQSAIAFAQHGPTGLEVEGLLQGLVEDLFKAVRAGEAQGAMHARRLSTAMLFAGPQGVSSCIITRPAMLAQLQDVLVRCFAFDQGSAHMLLHARSEGGPYVSASSSQPASAGHSPAKIAPASSSQPEAAAALSADAAASTAQALAGAEAAVLLPRMPVCLYHLAAVRTYEAVANVARCLGHLARLADVQAVAGGSNLRRVVDQLSSVFGAAAARASNSTTQASAITSSWQCDAAAAAATTTEVLFGASPAWQPPITSQSIRGLGKPSGADPEYEALAIAVLQQWVQEDVWKLPTHAPSASELPEQHRDHLALAAVSYQDLGNNTLLLRVLCEGIGAAAHALGTRFVANGRLLRAVLVPLLERLADPCRLAAEAAAAALGSICMHSSRGTLAQLVAANGDYVVDAVCWQLRDPASHPRAPHLLAALLRKAGIAPTLLPLMAEPLRHAVQGISIMARHQQPQYVQSFIQVLMEVSQGAGQEAQQVLALTQAAVARLTALFKQHEADSEHAASHAAEGQHQQQQNGTESNSTGEAARNYFMQRLQQKEQQAGLSGVDLSQQQQQHAANGAGVSQQQAEHGSSDFVMGPAERQELEDRFRRLHAAAVMAGAVADAAAPLMISPDLKVAMSAMAATEASLQALQATTTALETEQQLLEELGGPEAKHGPTRPQSPKLLPAVVTAWQPLLALLHDARTAAVERAVALLGLLAHLAGGRFLSRRFQQEAVPLMGRLLERGTAYTSSSGGLLTGSQPGSSSGSSSYSQEPLAPAAIQRVRVAVLKCLAAVCECSDGGMAVRGVTWMLAQWALPYLGGSQPTALQKAATKLLLSIAQIDSDAVWLLLFDTVSNWKTYPVDQMPQPMMPSLEAGPADTFPPIQQLLPCIGHGAPARASSRGGTSTLGGHTWVVTPELAKDCGACAQMLLTHIETVPTAWHATALPLSPKVLTEG